jgi:hypothetical protein
MFCPAASFAFDTSGSSPIAVAVRSLPFVVNY